MLYVSSLKVRVEVQDKYIPINETFITVSNINLTTNPLFSRLTSSEFVDYKFRLMRVKNEIFSFLNF